MNHWVYVLFSKKANSYYIGDTEDLPDQFEKYWNEEQIKDFKKLAHEENLSEEKTEQLIENYLFAEREPLRDEHLDLIEGEKHKVLERKKTGNRILSKIIGFVETLVSGFAKVGIELEQFLEVL